MTGSFIFWVNFHGALPPEGHGVAFRCAKSQDVGSLAVAEGVAASAGATDPGEGRLSDPGDPRGSQGCQLTGDGEFSTWIFLANILRNPLLFCCRGPKIDDGSA